ncbi:sensor histidine kinase [Oceanithermus sp.]
MRYTTRLTLVFGIIWALLLALSLTGVYFSLRAGLEAHVLNQLKEDAAGLAKLYNSGTTGKLPATGGTYIAVYDFSGNPVVMDRPEHRIPPEVLADADGQVPHVYRNSVFAAAYISTSVGILAVSQDLTFIDQLTEQIARTALVIFLLTLPLGWLLVRWGVGWASKPLTAASEAIAKRRGADLSPIPYEGPDDELGLIVSRFNGLLAELREARARERVFLAEVSHELRTPLTVLLGYLERLRRNPADKEALAAAERTARHLTRLVADLLALARGEAERTVNPHIVDLAELTRSVAQGFPGVRFEARSEPEVLGDPDRLMQLVRNLVANAVRAAGRPEGVRVTVGEDGGRAWVEVADDGPGIDPEILPNLFERFSRGPEGGTGLGLAIAKQITEAHEGRISVWSEPGRTVFRVELPGLEGEG